MLTTTPNMLIMIYGLFILIEGTLSLQLLKFHIPGTVAQGTRAALSCRWRLDPSEVLYSVKWYKDGKEFFRYVPRDVESRRKFPLSGVDVEEFDSSGTQIVLAPAGLDTGGRYRCEVSGEGPLFPTVSEYADIVIVALPTHGPSLSGLMSSYRPGDRLLVNCTSGLSRPPTHLAWYLNGEPLPLKEPRQWNELGLVASSIALDFLVREVDFRNNVLKLKCLATITPIYWRSNEESVMLDKSRYNEKMDKRSSNKAIILEQVQSNSGSVKVNVTTIMAYIVVMNLFYSIYM